MNIAICPQKNCSSTSHIGLLDLTIEPRRMVSRFWAHSPISLEHMSFWCLFLDPHITTYHSNTSVQIIVVLELGTSALCSKSTRASKFITSVQYVGELKMYPDWGESGTSTSVFLGTGTTGDKVQGPSCHIYRKTLLGFWRINVSICVYFKTLPRHSP